MQNRLLIRTVLLFLITTCFALALQSTSNANQVSQNGPEVARDRRFLFFKKKKPGFFGTLFSVTYEQWMDSKNTFNKISQLVNDNFAPENPPPTVTTVSSDPNATTTQAPFKITRSEFNRILRRNLKGLARLLNLELRDAFRASDTNYVQYKKNVSAEVSKFL